MRKSSAATSTTCTNGSELTERAGEEFTLPPLVTMDKIHNAFVESTNKREAYINKVSQHEMRMVSKFV